MSLAPVASIALAAPLRVPLLVWAARESGLRPALEAAWLARLPLARRAAIAALPEARARHRSLIASRLLAGALQALGFGEHGLASLRYPPGSKPTLALPVDFSLSHGGGQVLCAVSTAGPVGIDVEAIAGVTASEFLHYLNDDERDWAGRDAGRFASVWTRKEAVVKAAGGAGLRDLPRVTAHADGRTAMLDGQTWRTRAVPLGAAHVAHLAYPACPDCCGELAWQLTRLTRDQLDGCAASA